MKPNHIKAIFNTKRKHERRLEQMHGRAIHWTHIKTTQRPPLSGPMRRITPCFRSLTKARSMARLDRFSTTAGGAMVSGSCRNCATIKSSAFRRFSCKGRSSPGPVYFYRGLFKRIKRAHQVRRMPHLIPPRANLGQARACNWIHPRPCC